MSSSSQAVLSQAHQHEANELVSEIAFQRVLLSSIDDSVENRSAAEDEVRAEIKTLEKRLRALRRDNSTTTSQPTQPSSSRALNAPAAPSKPREEAKITTAGFRPTGSVYQAGDQALNLSTTPFTLSTPDLDTSLEPTSTPLKMDLPSRKRTHSTQMDGSLAPYGNNKSRRTTPSPYATDAETPSTSDLDDDFEMFDTAFFNAQQKAIEDRIKQENTDAQLAHSIANENPAPPAAVPSNPRNAFDRLSGIRPSASSSASSNSSRHVPSLSHNQSLANVKRERASISSLNHMRPYSPQPLVDPGRLKKEHASPKTMPGAFVEDYSTASDSDIEIIPQEDFRDNGRHNTKLSGNSYRAQPLKDPRIHQPSYSPEAMAAGEAARRRADLGPIFTNQRNQLYDSDDPPGYSNNMATHHWPGSAQAAASYRPLPNSSQGSALPRSYPHSGASVQGSVSYGGKPAYGQYSMLPEHHGMYSGQLSGSLHDSEPVGGYSLNIPAGAALGQGYNYSESPFMGSHAPQNLNSYLAPEHRNNIFSRPTHLGMADQFDYIMNDPRKTDEEIKTLLENIRPDVDLPVEDREGTPEGLVYPLYEHQKLALTWMKAMEEGTNKGGILADDMGLGKTISTLALILSRPSTNVLCKTTLIVGPVALVRQWDREIRTKLKASYRLSTLMYHGQAKKPSWDELRTFDIVLTTYGTLGAEFRRLEKWLLKQRTEGHGQDFDQAPMRKLFPLLGFKSNFYRVILDEAQCIKNKATNASRAAKELQALTRFCLTGTPMMNNVGELYSLIHFLRIKPYNEWSRFKDAFGMLTKSERQSQAFIQSAMRKLQAVIKAILLRRTKKSLIDGKPILNLPPKTEEIRHVVFNEAEQDYYNSLETKTKIQFNKYMRANTVGKNYSNVLVLLLRLRQACCHPHLITDFEEAGPGIVDLTMEAMEELAKTLSPDVIARLKAAEAFDCPVCYDAVDNPTILLPCGHDTCAECLTKVSDQAAQQDQADGNEAPGGLKCPVCRGNIDLKKIIHYSTFKKVHMPDEVPQNDDEILDGSATEMGTDSDSDSDFDSGSEIDIDEDADGNGNLKGFIVPDDINETESEDDGMNGDDEAEVTSRRNPKAKKSKKENGRRSKKSNKKAEHLSLAMLKMQASKSAEGRRRYMRYLRKNWEPSAKVDKCVELLEKFQADGKKTIIFSQFVSLLDLVQVPLEQKRWKCERYDGSMKSEARNDAIVRFTDDANTKIMLVSLKAGNAGLNLVAASRVIILDPFWNPFIEMQAVDRAYRIGQQNAVEVHRILIKGTVEDRIVELQEKKRKLVESALDEVASKEVGRLGVQQLAFLFGVDHGN